MTSATRIQLLDSLRGIALLGILLINIPFFGLPYQFTDNILLNNETGLNFDLWWSLNIWFEGTMRALFSILFGASNLLLIHNLEEKKKIQSPAAIYYRRLLWLWIFGLANAYILLWPGDILYTYAIAGIFLFPLRKLKPIWLLLMGLIVMLISTMIITLDFYDKKYLRERGEQAIVIEKQNGNLNEEQKTAKYEWITYTNENNRDALIGQANQTIESMSGGYADALRYVIPVNFEIQTDFFVSLMFWDALCFFLIGMAFFKWGLLTGELSKLFYWVMLIGGYSIGLWIGNNYLNSLLDAKFDRTLLADRMGWDLYQLKRLFMCMGHIGLIILLYKYGLFKRAFNALAKVGQMAFTNYLMQSILCGFIFHGYGFGLFGQLQRYELYFIMASIWIIQIIFSNYWLKHHRYGPLEWLWRWLIYWGKMPRSALG